MTIEDIKRIVDDERAERLTARLCRHWQVATERLGVLVQDLETDMDTCVEAEVYAAVMRMQSCVTALMELNKMPTAFLFSEYLERVAQTVTNTGMRQSVMTLVQRLLGGAPPKPNDAFYGLVSQMLVQQQALPKEQQKAVLHEMSPLHHIFALCAQYLSPADLMTVATVIQNLSTEEDNPDEVSGHLNDMRQSMEEFAAKMSLSLQTMLIWLMLLMLLPGLMVQMMQQSRTDSRAMAQLFYKVLVHVRKSQAWNQYWEDYRKTLQVVNDKLSWKEVMTAERSKERGELGKVPMGLFAKWTTDRDAFAEKFLDAHLSDDDLRHFIFHLAALSEVARELNPLTKFGEEQLVHNETQQVGEAVLEAAHRLDKLVTAGWFPHYDAMWQELIQDETIFAHLKVMRKSPHNNLFTARFFCHLVGEMKKSAVFGAHSDGDLAKNLTETRHVGTFRKNIQEGMGVEAKNLQQIFNSIYQKHKNLVYPRK